tara:strand:+ start:127 stop:747 length:621 start_codon:yes stop_codon:yes gene_type:complete
MFELLGTQYGGWFIDLSLVPKDSTVISAGVGEDISFDLQLIKSKSCNVVGIDPTEKSARYIRNNPNDNFRFIQKALYSDSNQKIKMYKNQNPEWVSESITPTHNMVSEKDYYSATTISIGDLLEEYNNVSILKMDIEGSEYKVLNNLKQLTIPQVCVEFHHFCTDYKLEETKKCIKHLMQLGYNNFVPKPNSKFLAELTFVHDSVL